MTKGSVPKNFLDFIKEFITYYSGNATWDTGMPIDIYAFVFLVAKHVLEGILGEFVSVDSSDASLIDISTDRHDRIALCNSFKDFLYYRGGDLIQYIIAFWVYSISKSFSATVILALVCPEIHSTGYLLGQLPAEIFCKNFYQAFGYDPRTITGNLFLC